MSHDEQLELDPADSAKTRRDLLTKGTVAAAVAAVAGAGLSSRANAANGDTVYVGQTHSGSTETVLNGGGGLRVTGGGTNNASITGASDGGTGAVGVYGISTGTGGAGVYGEHTGSSVSAAGVIGESNFGYGVVGIGSSVDVRAGGTGKISLRSSTIVPTSSGSAGTIGRDTEGALWYCVSSFKWRRVAGPTTAGAFVPVTPFRVYDSRSSDGIMGADDSRVISVADALDVTTGAVSVADAVPEGATAIAYNITITGTALGGFLYVADGAADDTIAASTINWTGSGQTSANSAIVKLDTERQIKVLSGPTGGTQFIIDVAGYYL